MSNPLIGTRSVFTKTVSVLTSVATLLTLSGTAYLAPLVANAAVPSDYGLTEGNMISATGSNDPDVYIVNAWGYKRLFLNPAIFAMYGQLSGGWASVKSVSSAARDAFPTTQLFRNCETNNQAVYAVAVTGEDTATLHHVVMSGDAAVAQDANFFKKVFCVNTREQNWYGATGSDYTSLSQIPPYVRNGATPTPSYGALSASLSSDNPATGTLVQGQASADLAHFMFTGSGTVNSIKLQRLGVSADTDLANVYLYQGSKRLTDAATVSSGVISFNDSSSTGLFQVNGSAIISVRADMSSTNGETVGVALTNWNGNSVNLSGNLFTVANATLATTVLGTSASTTPGTNSALDPAKDVVVFQNTTTIGTRYVWLKSLQFRSIGSAAVGDIQNFRLYVDGAQVGSAISQTDANGYIVFDMTNSPVKLETGGRVIKVMADVIGGSGKNFYLSIRQAPDFFTVDSQYGQPVLATVSGGSFALSTGVQTITSGTLTFVKTTDSPSGDSVKGASGVVLGRYTLTASGERMKVESLRANFTYAPLGVTGASAAMTLRNGALFANGVQVGSTADLCSSGDHTCSGYSASASTSYTQYNLGSSLIVVPGTPVTLEVRADVFDNDGTNDIATTDTIQANIAIGSSNVQRLTTLDYQSLPAAATPANTLTVKTGTLTAGKYSGFANQSVVSPSTNTKIGHFTLTSSSAENVNVNTITLDATYNVMTAANLTNVYIQVWNDTGSLIYTSPIKSTFSGTASNSYSVNFSLPTNKSYQVQVFGDIASGLANADSVTLNMDASGITAGSSTAATATQVTGQVVSTQAGSLTKANGSLQAARLAQGGTTVNAYAFTLAPAYDNYTLDEVYVDIPAGSVASVSGAIATLLLKDVNGNVLATANVNPTTGSASFTGLNKSLLQSSGTQTFKVDVQLANVGNGFNDSYGTVVIRLDGLKFHNSSGTVTTQNGYATTFGGNNIVDVAGYPVFSDSALGTTLLSTGAKDIFATNVSSVGTGAALKRVIFSVTTSNGPTIGTSAANNLTNGTYKIFKDGTDITSFGAIATGSADLKTAAAHTGAVSFTFTNDEALEAAGHVYKLQVNVTATSTTPQSIVTQITNNSTTASAPTKTTDTTLVPVVPLTTSPSVVWTDSSTVAHSATTDDWFNDYLIKTINVSKSVSL